PQIGVHRRQEAATVDTAVSNSKNSIRTCIIRYSVWGRKKEMKKKGDGNARRERGPSAQHPLRKFLARTRTRRGSIQYEAGRAVATGRHWVGVGCEVGLHEGEEELEMWTALKMLEVADQALSGPRCQELPDHTYPRFAPSNQATLPSHRGSLSQGPASTPICRWRLARREGIRGWWWPSTSVSIPLRMELWEGGAVVVGSGVIDNMVEMEEGNDGVAEGILEQVNSTIFILKSGLGVGRKRPNRKDRDRDREIRSSIRTETEAMGRHGGSGFSDDEDDCGHEEGGGGGFLG
uniref:Uncharacterized protein n=1 Tax=Oryza glaberrima TaxID=4538 RepID=I1QJC2_ORYGL